MTILESNGPMPASIQDMVSHIARALGMADSNVDLLEQQLRLAVVTSCSSTMLDVRIPPTCSTLEVPDGPLNGRAYVLTEDGEMSGEILIWFEGGRFTGLEQAWITDDGPTGWPTSSLLQVDP